MARIVPNVGSFNVGDVRDLEAELARELIGQGVAVEPKQRGSSKKLTVVASDDEE